MTADEATPRLAGAVGALVTRGRWVLVAAGATLLLVVALVATAQAWAGWMPAVFSASQNVACLFGAVVGSLVLAWHGLRTNPLDRHDESSVDARFESPEWDIRTPRVSIAALAIALSWGFVFASLPTIAALVVNAVAYQSVRLSGVNLLLWIVWGLGTWAFISAMALLGGVLGNVMPSWLSMLVVGVTTYAITWVPILLGSGLAVSTLLGYFDLAWFFYEPTLLGAAMRAALWIGVLVLVLAISLRTLTWITMSSVVILGSLVVGSSEGTRLAPVSTAFQTACTGEDPRVCTPLPFESSLDTLDRYLRPGIDLLPADAVAEVVGTHPFVRPGVAGSGMIIDPTNYDSAPSNIPSQVEVVAGLGQSYLLKNCSATGNVPESTLAPYLAFVSRVTDGAFDARDDSTYSSLVYPDDAAVARAATATQRYVDMSDDEFEDFLKENLASIQACGGI